MPKTARGHSIHLIRAERNASISAEVRRYGHARSTAWLVNFFDRIGGLSPEEEARAPKILSMPRIEACHAKTTDGRGEVGGRGTALPCFSARPGEKGDTVPEFFRAGVQTHGPCLGTYRRLVTGGNNLYN